MGGTHPAPPTPQGHPGSSLGRRAGRGIGTPKPTAAAAAWDRRRLQRPHGGKRQSKTHEHPLVDSSQLVLLFYPPTPFIQTLCSGPSRAAG